MALQDVDNCSFGSYQLYSPQDMYNCFNQIQPNYTQYNETLTTLISLFNIYVFRTEGSYENRYNIPPINITQELTDCFGKNFTSDFDFHNYINDLTKQFYDAHTKYRLPFGYGDFYSFSGVVPYFDKQLNAYKLILNPNNNELSEEYVKQFNEINGNETDLLDDIQNQIIVKINEIDPYDYLQQQANKYSFYEKQEQARYNELMQGLFGLKSFRTFGDAGVNDTFTVEFANGNKYNLGYRIYTKDEITSESDLTQLNKRNTEQVKKLVQQEILQLKSDLYIQQEHRQIEKQQDSKSGLNLLVNEAEGISLYQKDYNGENYFLLTIKTFSPNDVSTWVSKFQECMSKLDEYSSGHLVVMTAQNGGGYITLGFRALSVLCPYMQPVYGLYNIVEDPVNEFFVTSTNPNNTFSTQVRYNASTKFIFENNEWYFDTQENINGTSFSGKYSFDLAYDETPEELYQSLSDTKTPNWLNTASNNLIAFIADGTCGSTCFCFMGRGRIANIGLFLGIGGNPEDLTQQLAVASYAGGSVMDTSYTDQFNLEEQQIYKFQTSAALSFAHEEIFNWNQTDQSLEYEPVLTHDRIPVYWESQGWYDATKLEEILDESQKKLTSQCYEFMKIQTDCSGSVKHGIYGLTCQADGSYGGECQLLDCELGYYYNSDDNKCDVIKPVQKPVEDSGSNTAVTIAISVTVAVLVVIAFVGLLLYIRKVKQMKQTMVPDTTAQIENAI